MWPQGEARDPERYWRSQSRLRGRYGRVLPLVGLLALGYGIYSYSNGSDHGFGVVLIALGSLYLLPAVLRLVNVLLATWLRRRGSGG